MARAGGELPGVSDVLVPQDVDYPALKIDIDRERASELGLSAKEVLDSLITALTSDGMIAPSYWIDPKTGNNYLLTVQYPEGQVKSLADLGSMPLRAAHLKQPTRLDSVVHMSRIRRPPKWIITRSGASSMSMSRPPAKRWIKCMPASKRLWMKPNCRKTP